MRRLPLLVITLALLLGACSGSTTPEAERTSPPSATESTEAPEKVSPTEESSPSAGEIAPSQGLTIYSIIPGESTVTYEVGETFFNQNNRFAVAIGVTPQVNGEIQLDQLNPQNSRLGVITIDISQFKSDSNRRDNAIRDRWLESSRYPIATFTPTSLEGLPGSYTEGQELAFKITGDLTIKETTRPTTFDVTVTLAGGSLTGVATTTILMSDFGVGPVEITGILGTEDQARLTLNLVAR